MYGLTAWVWKYRTRWTDDKQKKINTHATNTTTRLNVAFSLGKFDNNNNTHPSGADADATKTLDSTGTHDN